ncbi:MAG: response regulator [Chloroflexota bacterium]|nr:response regulator [Chloroflexota bacterium]
MQFDETKEERRIRILVVDDDNDIANYLAAVLTLDGYEAIETHRAEHAIQIIRQNPPDLVLTDLMMPGLGGLGLLTYLKQDRTLPFIPVIMITALHDNIDKAAALEAGCDDFLSKPVNKAELQARVRSLLRLKRTNDILNRKLAQREHLQSENAERLLPKPLQRSEIPLQKPLQRGLEGLLSNLLNKVEAGLEQGSLSREELSKLAEGLKQALEVIARLV